MSKDLIPQPKKGGVLKTAIRSLSPNAAWDAIKNAPSLYAWIIGGGTVIGTFATTVIQRVQGLPQDVIGILLIAFLWLLVLTLVYSVSWYKRRRTQSIAETSKNETPQQLETILAFKEQLEKKDKRINALEEEKAQLEKDRNADALTIRQYKDKAETLSREAKASSEKLASLKWLEESAERDKNTISGHVHIIFQKVNYEGISNARRPYIEIVFYVINASVYNITIDNKIHGGAIYLNNDDLNPNDATIHGTLQNITRDERELRPLVIKQRLASGEAADIRNPQPGDKLRLGMLHLAVRGKRGDYETEWQRLHLPSEIPIVKAADELIADYTARLDRLNAAYESHTRKIHKLSEVLGRGNEIEYIFSKQEITYPALVHRQSSFGG
jgi:hypothetical protein